jgi:dimethylargininase
LCVRSDDDGREALRECLLRFGIESLIVPFDGSRENGRLHLTTAMSFVGMVEGVPTLLINPRAVRCVELLRSFGFRVLETPQGEEWAANALYLGKRLIFPQGYPLTKELLSNAGIRGLIFASFSLIGATETSPTCLTNLEVDPF